MITFMETVVYFVVGNFFTQSLEVKNLWFGESRRGSIFSKEHTKAQEDYKNQVRMFSLANLSHTNRK